MIAKAERKEAARQFKERNPSPRHLRPALQRHRPHLGGPPPDAAQNSQVFQLRQRLHRNKASQAEWNAHGEESFGFEVSSKNFRKTPVNQPARPVWLNGSRHGQSNRKLESNASELLESIAGKLTVRALASSILKLCQPLHRQTRSSNFQAPMSS